MSQNVDCLAIPYNGPAALEPAWRAFAANYAGEGNGSKVRDLQLLNELVFQLPAEIKAETEPAKHAALTEQKIKAFIDLHGGSEHYEDLRRELQGAISANANHKVGNPLNKAITNHLADLWLALEKARNLPVLLQRAGLQKTPEWETYQDLFRSPEGGLVSGALLAGVNGVLEAQSKPIAYRYKEKGIILDQVHSLAFDVYKGSLFRYENDKGATFLTYLANRLKQGLPRLVMGEINKAISLDAELATRKKVKSGMTLYDVIADEKSEDPLLTAIEADGKAQIEGWLKRLTSRDAEIIRLRFGVGGGEYPRAREEVGEILGVSRERIRQLEMRVMKKLQHYAGVETAPAEKEPEPGVAEPVGVSADHEGDSEQSFRDTATSISAYIRRRRSIEPQSDHIRNRTGRVRAIGDDGPQE